MLWMSELGQSLRESSLVAHMATHSSVLAWRIPGTGEPGGLPSMGSHRVGHDWSDLAAATVKWKITSSVTQELHFHGYDLQQHYSIHEIKSLHQNVNKCITSFPWKVLLWNVRWNEKCALLHSLPFLSQNPYLAKDYKNLWMSTQVVDRF